MDKDWLFGVIIPVRNVPAERCLELARQTAANARAASFAHRLTILFLVNDSQPGLSAELDGVLARHMPDDVRFQTIYSDRDYLTVEENLKHNLMREFARLPDAFLMIGSSDEVDFAGLNAALSFFRHHKTDLLLVGVNNSEMWRGKILRTNYGTPPLSAFRLKGLLPPHPCVGPDIFRRAMLDYGPVDYLAYIGCQIYARDFFRDLCAVPVREPLYSLPVGTLDVTERGRYTIGYFPAVVATRIDILTYGPDNPDYPEGWWVTQSRLKRGLSANIAMSVLSSSLGLCDSAFLSLIYARMLAISRCTGSYSLQTYLNAAICGSFTAFVKSQREPICRLSPGEIDDIVAFGARLESVDLRLAAGAQAKICSWLKRFGLITGREGTEPLRQWIIEGSNILPALLEREPGDFWFMNDAA